MKTTKTLISALTIAAVFASSASFAGHKQSAAYYYDYADVEHVDPIIKTITIETPHQECGYETRSVPSHGHHSATPTILGAVLGGAIANGVSKKSNRNAMTVVGTLLGGTIGRDIGHTNERHHRRVTTRVCNDTYSSHQVDKVVGYNVTYSYEGHRYTTHTKYDPGDELRVRIGVVPAEGESVAEY
ncbi:MAG TPA: glycine zipper 2TM domain-containing protein [Chromatiaceae bacterium]|jgi:uncharacterized protein YcfJ|nr:glycine zipper 2TM domain-containing protein [Chromatiaceae bacterium]HIA08886.1 glycine zipper 2TM domain-containing protein [Chromatiaceae bacterium]HIO13689.1 glycine zipper 2TM domain-containing protein [Chromatiales bacterium]HIO54895.1 glycine zipper 2TM domain-containing protein [Chromatiales bacterium]